MGQNEWPLQKRPEGEDPDKDKSHLTVIFNDVVMPCFNNFHK